MIFGLMVRLLLTGLVLVGVYHETGVWTTFAIGIAALRTEILGR